MAAAKRRPPAWATDKRCRGWLSIIGPEFMLRSKGTCNCIGDVTDPEEDGAMDALWFKAGVRKPCLAEEVLLYLQVSVRGRVVQMSTHDVADGDATKWHNW